MVIFLKKNPTSEKKFRVTFEDGKHVDFGARGYSDFTLHKDPARMKRYLQRHRARENWTKTGIKTAGFWSRWLLWSYPSLPKAKTFMEKKFHIKIKNDI